MLTTLKLALLLMTVGFSLYLFFAVLGVSTVQYHHAVVPSLSERTHPLKKALKVNETFDIMNVFHDIYYDPYDLYI